MKKNPEHEGGRPSAEESHRFREVSNVLRSWPDAPAPDLADRVLAAVRPTPWRAPLVIAAGFLLLLGATLLLPTQRKTEAPQLASVPELDAAAEWMAAPPAPEPNSLPRAVATTSPTPSAEQHPLEKATAWLLKAQDRDGGWSMGHTGAAANYTVGLSALALLALQPDGLSAQPEQTEALRRGLDFLVDQQDPETGLFGPDITGSLYNHTLACLALLAAPLTPAYAKSLQAGVDLLIQHQRPEGGWNYLRARAAPSNSSLTSWALLVLLEADARGVAAHPEEIARGLAWLQTTVDEQGRAGYRRPGDHPHGSETLTAAAALCLSSRTEWPNALRDLMLANVRDDARGTSHALDYYRTYFQATALREAGLADAPEIGQLTSRMERAQDLTSEHAGSWSSDDPWARTGGRVYSTALAMLVLRDR